MISHAREVKSFTIGEGNSFSDYSLCVAGGYPPPLTGMTIATERLYDMLRTERAVRRINFAEGGRGNPRDKMTWNRLRAVSRYAKEIREAHSDVLIYANLSGSIPGHLRDLYVFKRGVPSSTRVICWVHNGNIARHYTALGRRWSARYIADKVHRFVMVSKLLDRRLAPYVPAERRRVIPYTIDEVMMCSGAEVERAQEARQSRSHPVRLLYVSNMIRSKGYEDLLDAVVALRSVGYDVSVEFAGRWIDPEDEGRFLARIAERGMTGKATVHGPVSDRTRLKALMLEADVFVLPSYYPNEASPICLIEALNAGLPVVSTDHAGIPDTIHHEVNGRLARPNDSSDLAHQLSFLMEKDYRMAMGERARASFEQAFAPEVVRALWLDLLAEVGASLPGRGSV
jgi:glycosyltransferase involved in cell wall biosynthesis